MFNVNQRIFKIESILEEKEKACERNMRDYYLMVLAELDWRYNNSFSIDATLGTFGFYVDGKEVKPNGMSGDFNDEDGNKYPFSDIMKEATRYWVQAKEAGYEYQDVLKTNGAEFNEFIHAVNEIVLFIENTEELQKGVKRAVKHIVGDQDKFHAVMNFVNEYCIGAYLNQIGVCQFDDEVINVATTRMISTVEEEIEFEQGDNDVQPTV